MEKYEWKTKKYDWGEIGKLKSKYRNEGVKIEDDRKNQIRDKKKEERDGYWAFGRFVKDGKLAKTEDFEFKYWMFRVNEKDKPHKPKFQRCSKEYNFIIEGKIKGRVGNTRNIILEAGDYIIIKPGFVVSLQQEIKEDVRGITIKVPSCKDDTVKKSECEKRFKKSYCRKLFRGFN